jgi:hypothetical protein
MQPIDMKTKLAVLANDLASRSSETYFERQVQVEAQSKSPASLIPIYPRSGISWPASEAAPQAPFDVDLNKVDP